MRDRRRIFTNEERRLVTTILAYVCRQVHDQPSLRARFRSHSSRPGDDCARDFRRRAHNHQQRRLRQQLQQPIDLVRAGGRIDQEKIQRSPGDVCQKLTQDTSLVYALEEEGGPVLGIFRRGRTPPTQGCALGKEQVG